MSQLKREILDNLLKQLRSKLEVLQTSALVAHEAATNSESKAENKYDTRGLEASYLAGAQSKRAVELAEYIDICESISIDLPVEPIGWNSLITITADDSDQTVFMLPIPGGLSVELENRKITTISLEAPLGKKLMNKKVGDVFELTIDLKTKEFEIIAIE